MTPKKKNENKIGLISVGFFIKKQSIWVVSSPPKEKNGSFAPMALAQEQAKYSLCNNISLSIATDGFIEFYFSGHSGEYGSICGANDAEKKVSIMTNWLYYLNAYIAALLTSYSTIAEKILRAFTVEINDLVQKYPNISGPGIVSSYNPDLKLYALPRLFDLTEKLPDLYGNAICPSERQVIAKEVFDNATDIFNKIVASKTDIQIYYNYMLAREALEDFRYESALIALWVIIEHYLGVLWKDLIGQMNNEKKLGQKKFINKKRNKILTSGREFTASVKAEMLSFQDSIPFDVYQRITTARKARNNWVHEMKRVKSDDAWQTLGAAQSLMSLVDDVELGWPTVTPMP